MHLSGRDRGGKDLHCGSAELSVNLGLTRGHGSLLLFLIILPVSWPSRSNPRHPSRGTALPDLGIGAPIHRVSRLSHFSTCVGRHSSSACSRSAGWSRASTNPLFS